MAIADLPDAELAVISVNEIGLIQKSSETDPSQPKHDDPVGFGFGAWARPFGRLKYYIGKIRLDAMRWKDGRRHFTEVGFIKLAVDELVDGDGKPVPMVAIYLCPDDNSSFDDAEQPVAIFTRRGIRFLAPVTMEAGGGSAAPAGGVPSRFQSDDGRYIYNVQGDPTPEFPSGRIVQYDTRGGADGQTVTPVAILRPEAI